MRSLRSAAEPVLAVLAVLALWELVARAGVLSDDALPPVTGVIGALVDDLQTGMLWSNVGSTMGAWAVGLVIVVVLAVPLGVALGTSAYVYDATHLTVEFLRTIPSIAALPVLVLLYGVGFQLTVLLVTLTAMWPLLIQTMYGVRDVDPVALETGRVYGLRGRGQFARIVLPSALPYVATGLRISGVMALILAVASSLIAGGDGIGAAIASAQRAGDASLLYARIVVTGLLGVLVTFTLLRLERRALHWHPAHREAQP